jgi:hypothetical protein
MILVDMVHWFFRRTWQTWIYVWFKYLLQWKSFGLLRKQLLSPCQWRENTYEYIRSISDIRSHYKYNHKLFLNGKLGYDLQYIKNCDIWFYTMMFNSLDNKIKCTTSKESWNLLNEYKFCKNALKTL